MKKLTLAAVAAFGIIANTTLFAGSFDYLSNQSAGYYMNTAKTASIDGADIAAYNPAGTALMGKGFHLDFSNQFLFKTYTEKETAVLNDEYSQTEPTLLLPNLHLVYNFGQVGPGKLAVYGSAGGVAGGGALDWADGTIGSNAYVASKLSTIATATSSTPTGYSSSVEAYSGYYGFGAGLSYAFLEDKVSASAGLRYTMAKRSGKIDASAGFNHGVLGAWTLDMTDDYEYSAGGFTPIFGLDVKPLDKLTLGVRYEMETVLKFKYSVNEVSATPSNAAFAAVATGVASQLPNYDDQEVRHDLPQILSVGADYQVTDDIGVAASATFYFMGNTTYDTPNTNSSTTDSIDVASYFGTGYDLNLSARYQAMKKLLLGASFIYSNQGAKDSLMEYTGYLLTTSANPVLNSVTGGLGAKYTLVKNLDVLVSGAWIQYLPKDVSNGTLEITYEKHVINASVGVRYQF